MRRALAVAVALVTGATSLAAQGVGKKLRMAVADFDFKNVRQSAEELFGAGADVGKALADVVSQQLPSCARYDVAPRADLPEASRSDPGAASQLAQSGVDLVLTGNVLAYGKQEGQGPGVNLRVGRVGLGRLGKTVSVAFVSVSVQFVGPGGTLAVTPVIAQGDASGSGTSLLGELDVAGLKTGGQINLSGQEFSKTTLGKATTKAVESLCKQVDAMYDQVASASAPAPAVAAPPPVAPAAPPAVPSGPLPAAYGAPITGPFVWGLYQFKGTEHFKYDAAMTEDGKKEQGWYTLDAKPGAGGNYQLTVAGQVGTDSFRSTTTVTPGQGIPIMQIAAMGPGAIILFSPVYMMFGGQQWQVGNEWSFNQQGEQASFKVESECTYAGVSGLRGVWRKNNVVMMDMCVSPNVALPLAVMMNDEDGKSSHQMTLVEFKP